MEIRILHKIKGILVIVFLLLISSLSYAKGDQPSVKGRIIHAKVINKNGKPINRAHIRVIGTNRETYTNKDGSFSINIPTISKGIIIDKNGYKQKLIAIKNGTLVHNTIILHSYHAYENDTIISIPYNDSLSVDRSTSAIVTISGKELETYPGGNLYEALAGRFPGLYVTSGSNIPGMKSVGLSMRGTGVVIYVDGVIRDASMLSAKEVKSVEVIKDYSGRGVLGPAAVGPVIWITTKKGSPENNVNFTLEYGMNTPTVLPQYVNSYNYAKLYNEALTNDGLSPIYNQNELNKYKSGGSALYPDVDYYNHYVKEFSPYRHANINFSGSGDRVKYFALLDYNGSEGLEKVGRTINSNQFEFSGNVHYRINDWIQMAVDVRGSYRKSTFPNVGGGSGVFNIFSQVLSQYPSNAHPIFFNDSLIVSDNYPINLTNQLINSGFGRLTNIVSQNDVILLLDLNRFVKGLTLKGRASLNTTNSKGLGKGGTGATYRLVSGNLQLVQPEQIDNNLGLASSLQHSRNVAKLQLNYKRIFGKHALTLNGAFLRAKDQGGRYQPDRIMNVSLRANYSYANKYVLQADLTNAGSMRLPEGRRFNTYHSFGLAWIVSNESFLQGSNILSYLKLYSSIGVMGIYNFFVPNGYNPYYLYQTRWQTAGSWFSGIPGSANSMPITTISQVGNKNYQVPKRRLFNVGVSGRLFGNKLAVQLNYFRKKNNGILSAKQNLTSVIVGGPSFLPVRNYAANRKWGFDGLIQYTDGVGDFRYSIGVNALYMRGKYLKVDEAPGLLDYRKKAGKDMDMLWLYKAEGLFQNKQEIASHNVNQSWGAVQPGDIKYNDYNGDGVVNQKDMHVTGAHSPRLFYGLNLSIGYKGFTLLVQGVGVADGKIELNSSRYFKINSASQNYSKLMLKRWPKTNNFPRLTTSSQNNVQPSTFWLRNASYLRIKNVGLSYVFNTSNKSWKIFVRGSNLHVFSGLNKYNINPSDIGAGIFSYPMLRTIIAGISLDI